METTATTTATTTTTTVEMNSLPRRDAGSVTDSLQSSTSKGTSSTIGALVNGVSGGGAVPNPSLGGASGGGASSREKSKSKERVGAGLLTPEKSASKSPLIGKKAQQKEEKDALRRIEAQKELNRDLAMAIMIAALTPPRHRKQRTAVLDAGNNGTGAVKVSLVPEGADLADHACASQLSISAAETPETRRKSTTTLNMTAASLNYSVSTSVGATPETSRKTGYGSYEVLNSLPRDVLFPPEDPTPPASNVAWAALACVLCPWMACCGVTAIKAGRESQRQTAAGNLKDARHHAERAKLCAGITFFVGAAVLLISVGFFLTR